MAEAAENDEKNSAGSSPMKLVIVMIVGALLLVSISMGGVFFLMKSMGMLNGGGGGAAHAPAVEPVELEPATYFPLEPAFVVNFKDKGRTRFLQVSMEIMTRDPLIIEDIKAHMPLIRNNLLLLLGNQPAEELHTSEGKEKIRAAALEELKRLLDEQTGRNDVEGLYFTSFVTQ